MIDIDTIGYFLFMEEQEQRIENRSIELDDISSEERPRENIGQV